MNLRLEFVGGPLRGSATTLPAAGLRLGRADECDLTIADSTLSRRHCSLEWRDGEPWVVDDGGRNGTFVNDERVKECRLRIGDRIQIGETIFVLEADTADSGSVTRSWNATATVELAPAESRYLAPAAADGPAMQTATSNDGARTTRDLTALLAFAHGLQPIRERSVIQRFLLDALADLFRADLVALCLFRPETETGHALEIVQRPSPEPGVLTPSGTVLQRVRELGRAVLSNDVREEADLHEARSVAASQVRSLLCAPLMVGEDVSGAIYVASTRVGFFFEREDLELIAALASLTGVAFENLGHLEWLGNEVKRVSGEARGMGHGLVGDHPSMQALVRFIVKAARVDTTVLVLGESGTGKELVARAIHHGSPRAGRPFVSLNCAALPENLLESELFGYEPGAFSDARRSKPGRLEMANGGTLFLDEVGELSPSAQAKLLRAIQEREVDRLGGTRTVRVDIRLIAATNRDLSDAVRSGTFRADFYHRLNVLSVTVPPLRDRRSDIPLLATHFLDQLRGAADRRIEGFSAQARECLMRYSWPGNVRELQNAIERAVVLGCSDRILAEDFPEALLEQPGSPESGSGQRLQATLNATKRRLVLEAFEAGGRSFAEAAKFLGVHPNHLHRLVRNLDLRDELDAARKR
ncbi:MAG TPA: sigma 54-interacting transcriptional regulator [Vicinamibacterales bacterium]|nr:sigma 54-interacting transcriptional regulator [Vicinamibacterales bacterium]